MTQPNAAALTFLQNRRSCGWNTLVAPAPGRAALRELLEIAARSPDHGMLVPWRFLVLGEGALKRLSDLALERGAALDVPDKKRHKLSRIFADAPLIVAVIVSPKPSDKAPEIEQIMTAGAVCLGLLNGAEAAGWGANWLTGWVAQDRGFVEAGLGLSARENIAGFIHIGTRTIAPTARARPDIDAITGWLGA